MSIVIKKRKAEEVDIRHLIEEMTGVDVGVCFQCKKCSNGCPMSSLADMPTSEILRRLHFGMGEELLDSDMIWTCASCEICSNRCPMGIDVAAVIDALKALSIAMNAKTPKGNPRLLNALMLKSIRKHGRTYDLGFISLHNMATPSVMFKNLGKFPTLLFKGKLALLPNRRGNRKLVKQIFDNLKDKEEKQP
jgi:heterodisulfide reductase subunit C